MTPTPTSSAYIPRPGDICALTLDDGSSEEVLVLEGATDLDPRSTVVPMALDLGLSAELWATLGLDSRDDYYESTLAVDPARLTLLGRQGGGSHG